MNRLKEIRQEKGLSQKQLAKLTGLSQGTISNIERGNTPITPENLIVFCRELHVNPRELFCAPEGASV